MHSPPSLQPPTNSYLTNTKHTARYSSAPLLIFPIMLNGIRHQLHPVSDSEALSQSLQVVLPLPRMSLFSQKTPTHPSVPKQLFSSTVRLFLAPFFWISQYLLVGSSRPRTHLVPCYLLTSKLSIW